MGRITSSGCARNDRITRDEVVYDPVVPGAELEKCWPYVFQQKHKCKLALKVWQLSCHLNGYELPPPLV